MGAGIPGVPGRAKIPIGAPAAVGELYGVGLADVAHACGHELADQRRRMRRDPVAPGLAAARDDFACAIDDVLDGNRDAMQRTHGMTRADRLFRGLRGEAGIRRIDRDERVEFGSRRSIRLKYSSRRSTGDRRRAAIAAANACTGRKAGKVIVVRFLIRER